MRGDALPGLHKHTLQRRRKKKKNDGIHHFIYRSFFFPSILAVLLRKVVRDKNETICKWLCVCDSKRNFRASRPIWTNVSSIVGRTPNRYDGDYSDFDNVTASIR